MKVTIENHRNPTVSIAEMPVGSVGVTTGGKIYVRAETSAICLNDIFRSYSNNLQAALHRVTLLPSGTIVTLEIEKGDQA